MKNSFLKWYTYLIAIGLIGIAVIAALVPYFCINDLKVWPKVYISYVFLLSGVVIAGVGFIIQDVFRAFRRKATKNWDYPLEKVDINKAWLIFGPCLLSGITCVVFGLISFLFFK